MHRIITPSRIWLTLALAGFGLAVTSVILTELLQLHPCYMCVFQRLLYLLIAGFATAALLFPTRIASLIFGSLVLLCALVGTGTAGHQVWLQMQPGAEFSCSPADPNLIEVLMTWLSDIFPKLFLATGNCASKELVIFSLSLAQWSLICFVTSIFLAGWALWQSRTARL